MLARVGRGDGPGEDHGETPSDNQGGFQTGQWLSITAAARELGVSRRAVQLRIARGTIHWRNDGNRGRQVLVSLSDVAGSARGELTASRRQAEPTDVAGGRRESRDVVELRRELAAERQRREAAEVAAAELRGEVSAVRLALDRERDAAAELRRGLDDAKADLGWSQGEAAELRRTLDRERERADRLECALGKARGELAAANRPLLLRLIEALRGRGRGLG